mgnify:CR=1 FL=1
MKILNVIWDYIINNPFELLAVIFTVISYQCKKHGFVLLFQTISTICVVISFIFHGAGSGFALNIVCIIRNLVYAAKNIKFFSYKWWPWFFVAVMGVVGAFYWDGPISLLMIIGLMINTVFLSFTNVQYLRWSILVSCALIIIYDFYFQAYGPIVMECFAVISAVIGIIRFRKKDNAEQIA